MHAKGFDFNLREFAGSLGDLGTLIPLSIALVTVNGLSFTSVFLTVGLFYVATGLYYRLPIPVQPLKVVAAIAIAAPADVTLPVMAATGVLFGAFLLLLGFTGMIDRLARIFTKPVIRGMQLSLGLILATKGISFIQSKTLFIQDSGDEVLIGSVPVNVIIGIAGVILVLLLLNSRRFPAALVVIGAGVIIGAAYGAFSDTAWAFGPTDMEIFTPGLSSAGASARGGPPTVVSPPAWGSRTLGPDSWRRCRCATGQAGSPPTTGSVRARAEQTS